jgi:hypothetical protein
MIKNKIMVLAIGIITLGGTADAKTLQADNGPAELPPASFTGKQYVDSKGCVYIKAGYDARITWVPRVNRQRKVFCSSKNKPSLSPAQLAAISGKPATRLIKPADVATETKTVAVASEAKAPAKAVKSSENTIVANVTPKNMAKPATVRGYTPADRRKSRDALRTGYDDREQTAIIRPVKPGVDYQQTDDRAPINATRHGVDSIYNLSLYPVVIDADITPRGDAQMALVWSDTVPRTLVNKGRAKRVASSEVYSASKSR